ncbi:hypothetical protein ABID82_003873 [Methylobacterium sp. PvP062]|jgi:hypothetical protein|uniref:O-antigen ligase-like membrane protein n=1 Tax=Methylobacterium radiotolerans (strain ATCC 27329 / DSM 1819 / JCM 2831 / NBRC 15690 / NCIMB 10815 / 0-1) TaxID=426355 RepID=B1M561_METRJ|nr:MULTISPECIES: hypothetical protein [Methylobacterium]MCX7331750.1 hypothetical protein [Hyphomicrobiales bacterium]GAN48546.1 hypothetical protein ME121_2563 [Methylobacterium sp. ME121]ACB26522.1 conserved hypothetical protein [Methylobacterium radiotolerans JCM 2831]KTS08087.1 integral cytoplasmic membrane protein [Methylobacterium radiotolerans]KTS50992.1 integral cytoplasmic membrane protein [Methylobacterium radiotolerans]
MSFEPIGAITVVVGLFCLLLGRESVVIAFVVFCNLGSAAALLLGGANVQPAHLFLVFLMIATLFYRNISTLVLSSFRLPEAGFWLLCLTLYGVASSYILPRLFAGQTYIVPLGTSSHLITSDGVVPLGPVSSNFTQPIYLIGDLVCFSVITAFGSTKNGIETLARALIIYVAANICFGIIDVLTAATGTQEVLQFIRNAQYTFHDEESVGSMRRIIGAWPEASAFAGMTLGGCGFTGMLWLCGRKPSVTGPLALISLLFVILSTSSTGLVGAAVLIAILYTIALMRCSTHRQDRFSAGLVVAGPLVLCVLVLLALSVNGVAERVYDYVDTLVLSKAETSSGVQRSAWNAYAWRNFVDSNGLGVGLGTNRTSSFPLAVLSNVGIPGAVFYVLFLASVFGFRRGAPRTYASDIRAAGRVACLCLLSGSIIAGPTVDQGLMFYIFAATACAYPVRGPVGGRSVSAASIAPAAAAIQARLVEPARQLARSGSLGTSERA